MNNGIKIYSFAYPATESFSEMDTEQRKEFWNVIGTQSSLPELRLKLFAVAINLKQQPLYKRLAFIMFVTAEHILYAQELGDFLLKPLNLLKVGHYVLKKSDPLSFIEFIRFDELAFKMRTHNDLCRAVAVRYKKQEKYSSENEPWDTQLIAQLNPEYVQVVFRKCLQEHEEVMNGWPTIFRKKGDDAAKKSKQKRDPMGWYKLLRQLSPNFTDMEAVGHMPANTVFFEISQKMAEIERIKKAQK